MWLVYFFAQGKISFNNLKRVAKELGENLTDEELQVRDCLKWSISLFYLSMNSKIQK